MRREESAARGLGKAELERFFARLAQAPSALLLLDYDGTLAPFHEDPARALPYPGVEPLLRAIMGEGSTRVAVVTGRGLEAIIPLLGLEPLPEIWASHGRERRRPNGEWLSIPPSEAQRQGLKDAQEVLSAAGLPGRLEEKVFSLAYHVRGLVPAEGARTLAATQELWEGIAKRAGLELLPFDGGLELRAPGWTKGDAVNALLGETAPGRAAAYLGDDETDEDAFRVMEGKGLSVLVRQAWRPTAARAWLRPPGELLGFLERWNETAGRAMGGTG